MKNHKGNWKKTAEDVNKKFSKGNEGRCFHDFELKKEYDNERRRMKRKGKKKYGEKKAAVEMKIEDGNFVYNNEEEKSSTKESSKNQDKDFYNPPIQDVDEEGDLPQKQGSANLYKQKFATDQNDKEHSRGMFEV